MEEKIKDIILKAEDLNRKIRLFQHEKTLPVIDLDIILRDIRVLYEEIRALQSNTLPETLDKSAANETPVPEPAAETRVDEKPAEDKPVSEAIDETTVDETTVDETIVDETPVDETPVDESPVHDEPVNENTEPTILADKYKGEKRYINESLAGNLNKTDIGSKIQSTPIQNIGSALGINDRFLLIKDLFNGDKESFQNTITVLNDASNFNEAFNYITSSFDWDMEEPSVQLLLDLVRRKFIVNQHE
jgi:hypothetical protein